MSVINLQAERLKRQPPPKEPDTRHYYLVRESFGVYRLAEERPISYVRAGSLSDLRPYLDARLAVEVPAKSLANSIVNGLAVLALCALVGCQL